MDFTPANESNDGYRDLLPQSARRKRTSASQFSNSQSFNIAGCSSQPSDAQASSQASHQASSQTREPLSRQSNGRSKKALPVQLPPIDTDIFVSNKHEVNPAIAINFIQEIHTAIIKWQQQQRQIIASMRSLHAQGPMVDGWLQSSHPSSQEPSKVTHPDQDVAAVLRHGDPDALMKYVESLEDNHQSAHLDRPLVGSSNPHHRLSSVSAPPIPTPHSTTHLPNQTQYWLCFLKDDGSVHSQVCPPEQMAVVGTAIARFQKFKQLKQRKQVVAAKLQRAVDMLRAIRDGIVISADG